MTTRIQLFLGLRDVTAKGVEEPYLHETSIRSIVALELCNSGHDWLARGFQWRNANGTLTTLRRSYLPVSSTIFATD